MTNPLRNRERDCAPVWREPSDCSFRLPASAKSMMPARITATPASILSPAGVASSDGSRSTIGMSVPMELMSPCMIGRLSEMPR